MSPDGEGPPDHLPAAATPLRGEARRNCDDPRASFLRFTLKNLYKFCPASIVYRLGEVMVFDHPRYIQSSTVIVLSLPTYRCATL